MLGKCNLIYSNRKQIVDCPEGSRVGQEREIINQHKKICESDEYVHYLECGDSFTRQNLSPCTL